MRQGSLMTMVTTAAATAVVTVLIAWPASVNATGPELVAPGPATVKGSPKLILGSCEFEAMTSSEKAPAGSIPTFTLAVRNTSATATKQTVKLTLTKLAQSDFDVISRMPPMSTVEWTRTIEIDLGPNERKTIRVLPAIAIAAGDSFTLVAAPDSPIPGRPTVQNPDPDAWWVVPDPRARPLASVTGSAPAVTQDR